MSAQAAVIRMRILSSPVALQPNMLGPAPSRMYHLVAPQNKQRPYLVYGIVAGAPEHQMLGAGGLWQGRVRIEGFFDSADDMATMSEVIRTTCDGFRGSVTVYDVVYSVRRLHLVDEGEDVLYSDPGKGLPVFYLVKELELDVSQSIPTF